jgi:hypothetical protein
MKTATAITLRTAVAADANELGILAVLDSSTLSPGQQLVAERDGRIVAAVSVDSGAVIADPFLPTAEAVELLSQWRRQRSTGRRTRTTWRPRLAPVR